MFVWGYLNVSYWLVEFLVIFKLLVEILVVIRKFLVILDFGYRLKMLCYFLIDSLLKFWLILFC